MHRRVWDIESPGCVFVAFLGLLRYLWLNVRLEKKVRDSEWRSGGADIHDLTMHYMFC